MLEPPAFMTIRPFFFALGGIGRKWSNHNRVCYSERSIFGKSISFINVTVTVQSDEFNEI